MRKYEMIFFDWDGTAVSSRKAPADAAAKAMAPLLAAGVKLAIVSGTGFMNIDSGNLAERFEPEHRANLYLGLDRGANNYGFDVFGNSIVIPGIKADRDSVLALHEVCFGFHMKLLKDYDLNTDIVFCRDYYCKIDVGSNICRGGNQFFSGGELERVNMNLVLHGYTEGVRGLITLAETLGRERGLYLKVTTDAKYIEMGFGTKADSVNAILSYVESAAGALSGCCFWGDEYLEMGDGIYGSDSYMITEKSKAYDFFDVSDAAGKRPEQVQQLGGGVERFLSFLHGQYILKTS